MAKQQRRGGSGTIEWIGGLARLSTVVDVAGVSIQPDILLWMNEEDGAVGFELGKPGGMLETAVESLREAMAEHGLGKPGLPQRLRVASPKLADALGKLLPKVEIVCAPTPELDSVLDSIEEQLRKDPPKPLPKQSQPKVGLETKAAVLQAVARLQKLEPWTVVPDFRNAIAVTVRQCGLRGGALSLSHDEEGGLEITLLAGREDFNAMVAYEEEAEREDREMEAREGEDFDEAAWFNKPRLPMPPFLSLTFNPCTRPTSPSPILAAHKGGWEPVSPDSSLWFIARDKEQPVRDPTLREAILMEAILLALPEILKEKEQLQAAWQDGAPFVLTILAATHVGEIEVLLGVL